MMKTIKKYIVQAIALMLLLPACENSILNQSPRDTMEISKVTSTLDGLEGAILGVYERGRVSYTDFEVCLFKTFYTDIIKGGSDVSAQPVWYALATFSGLDATNTGLKTVWDSYYEGLNRANTIISSVDNIQYNENNPIAVQRRNSVLGEAMFFRAYFHITLVEYWDNIFLADRVFTDPEYDFELADKNDVYDLIVTDLETAISLLPETSDVSSRGKVSKGVARHLLSLAYLDIENWGKAAELAEQVIADKAYSFAPIDQIFPEQYEENSEIIFSWQFVTGNGGGHWTACNLAPYYDRCNGVARTFEQGARPWARMSPNDYYWSLFEEKDLRLEAWHKRYWTYDIDIPEDPLPAGVQIGDTVTAENVNDVIGIGMLAVQPTTTKYWEGDALGRVVNDANSYKNVIQYRYSEAYLVAAEGYLRSGENLGRGKELLNKVRERAGLDPIDLTEANLLDEQARELGFEGRRFPMLKRLGILEKRIKEHSPEIGGNMMPFHVRWPIPQNDIYLTGVPQNEGYE